MAFKNILVTLDGSDLAETALKVALHAADVDARIHLLSVMEQDWAATLMVSSFMGEAIPLVADPRYAYDPRAIQIQNEYLDRITTRFAMEGHKITSQVEPGAVVETIVNIARKQGSDLIVMATHGRAGITRAVLGSVVADVLPQAPCPVLVVPPRV